jgi:hypothetical protein
MFKKIIAKYGNTAGNSESTMLEGIVHAYCDSGITTDGLSANDVTQLEDYFTHKAIFEFGCVETMNDFILAADYEFKGLEMLQAREDLDVVAAEYFGGDLEECLLELAEEL